MSTVESFGFFLRLEAKSPADCGFSTCFDCFDFFDFRGKKSNEIRGELILIKNRGYQAEPHWGHRSARLDPVAGKNFGRTDGRFSSSPFRSRAGRILAALALPLRGAKALE
jgi:hypothetical protein